MITERDILILVAVVRYYVLNRQQIQQLVFPDDRKGRITRRRLQMLTDDGFIGRQGMLYCHPSIPAAPVYYPSRKGCALLAEHFQDDRYLLTPTQAPIPHHTLHWLAVADTHIAFDRAIETQQEAEISGWINEWDIVNKDETQPERRYRLYTLITEIPRLICAPDAAFLVSYRGHSKVFYLEQDRATSGAQQIANSKMKGYSALAEQKLHFRHFPKSTLSQFSVLMVVPSVNRRESMRRAMRGKPGSQYWRFVWAGDLQPDRLLYEPIFHSCDSDEPTPLLRRT